MSMGPTLLFENKINKDVMHIVDVIGEMAKY